MSVVPSRSLRSTQELHRLHLVAQVQVDGRLVEEQDRRRLGHGEREEHELPLAQRELAGVAAQQVPEAHALDRRRHGRPVGGRGAAQRGLVREPPQRDHLLDPHREREARSAAGPRPGAARSRTGPARRSAAVEQHAAGGGAQDARERPAAAWTCRRRWGR